MKFRLTVRGVVFSALFAALLVVLSFLTVNVGISPIPFTMENMAVMLAGAILGPWYGFFSMFLIVILTALGLPLLHNSGGMADILGPTGGFIWSWPICALLTGWFAGRIPSFKGMKRAQATVIRFVLMLVVVEVFASLLNYVAGVPQLAAVVHLSLAKAMVAGCYPYLLPDFLKAIVVTLITLPIRQLYPNDSLVLGSQASVVKLEDHPPVTNA